MENVGGSIQRDPFRWMVRLAVYSLGSRPPPNFRALDVAQRASSFFLGALPQRCTHSSPFVLSGISTDF